MNWNKLGAIGSTLGGIFAALTFGMAIWPWPQIKAQWTAQGTVVQAIGSGPTLIAVFLLISFILSAISIYGAWRRRPSPDGNKLVIHSAVYGTGPIDDVPVTDSLQTAVRDALVIPVDNNLVLLDPAPNKLKRLQVEYSYGNASRFTVSRTEGGRLVLPQDSEIMRLTGEIGRITTRQDNPESTSGVTEEQKDRPVTLRNRIFDTCGELKSLLGKYGKRPNPYLIPTSDRDEYVRRYQEEIQSWDDKFQADYWLNFKERVLNLRHELALLSLTDDTLDKKLMEAETPALSDKTVETISERLRVLAAHLD